MSSLRHGRRANTETVMLVDTEDTTARDATEGAIFEKQFAWTVLALTDLSEGGYVQIRWHGRLTPTNAMTQWRVRVRWRGHQHTAIGPVDTGTRSDALLLACHHALRWLQHEAARVRMTTGG